MAVFPTKVAWVSKILRRLGRGRTISLRAGGLLRICKAQGDPGEDGRRDDADLQAAGHRRRLSQPGSTRWRVRPAGAHEDEGEHRPRSFEAVTREPLTNARWPTRSSCSTYLTHTFVGDESRVEVDGHRVFAGSTSAWRTPGHRVQESEPGCLAPSSR